MSLLTVVQAVAEEQGLPTISDATSDAPDAKLLRRLVNVECNALSRRYDWAALQEEHTFSSASGTASYALPDDFLRLIQQTAWNRTEYWQVRGATSPQEWQWRRSGLVTPSIRDRFRIKGNTSTTFFLDPTPTAIESYVFEYVSKNWAIDADDASAKSSASKNGDTFVFDEYLIERGVTWRWLSQKGFPYAEERDQYESIYAQIAASDGGGKSPIDMAGPSTYTVDAILPDGGFGQ